VGEAEGGSHWSHGVRAGRADADFVEVEEACRHGVIVAEMRDCEIVLRITLRMDC
jgi:hypothetical protein